MEQDNSGILTNDHVDPFDLGEDRAILDDALIGGQQDLDLTHAQLCL